MWHRSIVTAVVAAVACAAAAAEARAQGSCDEGASLRGDLGIEIACNCTVNRAPTADRPWRFRGPIHVTGVRRGGPADGVLREGDRIIEIDGAPVTGAAGARRLAELRPGESVRLGVVRDGRTTEVRVTSGEVCSNDPRALGAYAPAVPTARMAPTAPATEQGSRSGAPAPVPLLPDLELRGWLGFALACRGCGWAREAGDSAPYWESTTPPTVYAVAPGSPAERAGLQAGDVLTHVNGQPLTSRAGGRALGAVLPGERLALGALRDGRPFELAMVAAERPAASAGATELRYRGAIGGVAVEIRGADRVDVSMREAGDEMVIVVGGTVIRLRSGTGGGNP